MANDQLTQVDTVDGSRFFQKAVDIGGGQHALAVAVYGASGLAAIDAPSTPVSYIVTGAVGGNTGVSVAAAAKTLTSISLSNIDAAGVWVKLYDKATAAASTDTPKMRIWVPTLGGNNLVLPNGGVTFALGISFRTVTGIADADITSPADTKVTVNLGYK